MVLFCRLDKMHAIIQEHDVEIDRLAAAFSFLDYQSSSRVRINYTYLCVNSKKYYINIYLYIYEYMKKCTITIKYKHYISKFE